MTLRNICIALALLVLGASAASAGDGRQGGHSMRPACEKSSGTCEGS